MNYNSFIAGATVLFYLCHHFVTYTVDTFHTLHCSLFLWHDFSQTEKKTMLRVNTARSS